MTTTYELYTNENGTPKAVEGKAPAIIERVETLETSVEALEGTLDNGVVTSVNGATGDVTPEQTGCLPLSGGKLTGAITLNTSTFVNRSGDDSNLQINGGSGWGKGASIELYGKDRTTDGGAFKVRATDGTNTTDFMIMPDGVIKVNGNSIITSVGGTFSGTVKFSGNGSVMGSADTTSIQIYGGTSWESGSMIGVYGKTHASRAGWVYLSAHNGTTSNTLIGKPDGALTWGGKNVVRSVNNTVADANGNVTISVSGGGTSAYKIPYATCSTASTTETKVATISNGVSLSLVEGAVVAIKFSKTLFGDQYGNTFKFTKLNVNSTGVKTVKKFNDNYLGGVSPANQVYVFVYDGTYWNMVTVGSNWDTYDSGSD